MDDLLHRLEAASEGSRELDEEIAGVVAGAILERQPDGRAAWHRVDHWVSVGPILAYTTSLAAALTLVPAGWTVARVGQNDDKTWFCELREGYLTSYTQVVFGSKHHHDPTPALALCIAALKARGGTP